MPMTEAEIFEGLGVEPPVADEGEGQTPPDETSGQGDSQEGAGQTQDTSADETDVSNSDTDEPDGEGQPPAAAPTQEAVTTTPPAALPQQGQPGGQPQGQPAAGEPSALDQPAPPEVRGRTNPYTGQVIMTLAQYQEYQTAYQADVADFRMRQLKEQMKAAGLDPDAFDALVKDAVAKDPTVMLAKEMSEAAKVQAAEAQFKEAMAWYDKQFEEINALDPEAKIKDLHDLQQRDPAAFTRMMGAVGSGMSLVEAYRAIHYDRLAQSRSAAAEQRVRNQAAGKAHLTPMDSGKTGAGEDVFVPDAVARKYQELNPGMTEADIRKEYARYLKESGGAAS